MRNWLTTSVPFQFEGYAKNCVFDSDLHQMRYPFNYQPATERFVTRRHVYVSGDASRFLVEGCTLNRSLFAFWLDSFAPSIQVCDYLSGCEVRRWVVPAGEQSVDLDLHGLTSGPYHYALEVDGTAVARHNLLVQ